MNPFLFFSIVSLIIGRAICTWIGLLLRSLCLRRLPPSLHSHYSSGIPAWSPPPHTLAYNVLALLYTLFYRPALLIEGFGAGAYMAAVAATFSLAPPKTFSQGSALSLLISLGGIAMHPPTFSRLIQAFASVHNEEMKHMESFLKPRPDKASRPNDYASPWKDNIPEFKTAMLLVQHVHDRVSPWTLSPLLLSYLYNLGIKVITLHDNLLSLFLIMKGWYPHSRLSLLPHSSPTSLNLLLMNNLKLVRADWAPPTALISWTFSLDSSPTWALSPLFYLVLRPMPSPKPSSMVVTALLLSRPPPSSLPPWNYMRPPSTSIPESSFILSASLPFNLLDSQPMTFWLLRRP